MNYHNSEQQVSISSSQLIQSQAPSDLSSSFSFKQVSTSLKTIKKKNVTRKLRLFGQNDDFGQKKYDENKEYELKYKREFYLGRLYKSFISRFLDFSEFIIHLIKFIYDYLFCCKLVCYILRTDQTTQRRRLIERKNLINKSSSHFNSPSSSSAYSTSILNPNFYQQSLNQNNNSFDTSNQNINLSIDSIQSSMKMYDDHLNNLVLDLDETLIHCDDKKLNEDAFQITVQFQDVVKKFYLHQRSFLQQFLEQCAQNFNIFIYTASTRQYAEEVVKHIDPRCIIKKIYCRDSCFFDGKQFNKSLKTLGLDLNRTVLIDNSQACISNNIENSFKIKDYICDKSDKELLRFSSILNKISQQVGSFKDFIQNYQS